MIKLTAITSKKSPHSTVAAFCITPTLECHVVHAGDSRVYHYRGAEMMRRTVDHSFVQRSSMKARSAKKPPTPTRSRPAHRLPGHARRPPVALWHSTS
jgi:serine/threonine protein phosphatase PrpC